MGKVLNIIKTTYDGYFVVVCENTIYKYEGRALCHARIQSMIDNRMYTEVDCFNWQV